METMEKFNSQAKAFLKLVNETPVDGQVLSVLIENPALLDRFVKAVEEASDCVTAIAELVKSKARSRDRSPKRKDKTYAIYTEVQIDGEWHQCNSAQTDKATASSASKALYVWWSEMEENAIGSDPVPRPAKVPCFKKRVILHRLYSDDEDIVLSIEGDENFID
jgi:hypothetical protein